MRVAAEDLYLMSNLPSRLTGLPFVVWISSRGSARYGVRVKVSSGPRAKPGEFITVAIRPKVKVVEGSMGSSEFDLLRQWIEQNRETLIAYWEGEIDTQDALGALVKL